MKLISSFDSKINDIGGLELGYTSYSPNVMEREATCHILPKLFQRCVIDITICRPSDEWILTGWINQGIIKLAVVTFHLHHAKFGVRPRIGSIAIVFYLRRMNK